MRTTLQRMGVVTWCVLSVSGCTSLVGDLGASTSGESGSSGTTEGPDTTDTTGALTSTVGSTGSPVPPDTSGEASTSGGSDSTGATGGAQEPVVDVELVVERASGEDWHLFVSRVVDGELQPDVPLHDPDTGHEWRPQFLPGRRVLLEAQRDGVAEELYVASLDGVPSAVRVDVGTEPPGTDAPPLVIPGGDTIVYSYEGIAYRVDLEDADVSSAIALVEHRVPFRPAADPQARYVLLQDPDGAVVRVPLDGGSIEPTLSASQPWLTPDGNGGFQHRTVDGVARVEYLPLGDGVGVHQSGGPEVLDGNLFSGVSGPPLVRTHPSAHGVVARTGWYDEAALFYVGVDGGKLLPEVRLSLPAPHVDVPTFWHTGFPPWSPDGHWLTFESGSTVWFADFGNGHVPSVQTVQLAGTWTPLQWAPDGSALYFNSGSAQIWAGSRVLLTGGAAVVQPLGGEGDSFSALSPDGQSAVVAHRDDLQSSTSALYQVDVSGDEPGTPVLIAEAEPGESLGNAKFSSSGRHVVYSRGLEDEATPRYSIASLDEPDAVHLDLGEALRVYVVPE